MWTARTGSRPSPPSWRKLQRRSSVLAALAWLAAGAAAAQPAPPHNRIYPLQGGEARLPVPAAPDVAWLVQDEAGRVVRPWGPADRDGALRLPPGGWYRLVRRDAVGGTRAIGHRFAAGLVILVTGQSQAGAFFAETPPQAGAFPATAADPPAPPVAALLHDCTGRPGCGADGTTWTDVEARLGARILLAELARRLGQPVPLGLANAAWGGASAAELAGPDTPAAARLRQVGQAAAPASAALILAHGTTDALAGTPPEAYAASLALVVASLRAAGGPAMPVLLAPLPQLLGPTEVLGSGRLAGWLLPWGGWPPAARAGLARRLPPSPAAAASAAAIRTGQDGLRFTLDLRPGGSMAGVTPGLDGIHWTADGVRAAAREAAAALALALGAPP